MHTKPLILSLLFVTSALAALVPGAAAHDPTGTPLQTCVEVSPTPPCFGPPLSGVTVCTGPSGYKDDDPRFPPPCVHLDAGPDGVELWKCNRALPDVGSRSDKVWNCREDSYVRYVNNGGGTNIPGADCLTQGDVCVGDTEPRSSPPSGIGHCSTIVFEDFEQTSMDNDYYLCVLVIQDYREEGSIGVCAGLVNSGDNSFVDAVACAFDFPGDEEYPGYSCVGLYDYRRNHLGEVWSPLGPGSYCTA